MKIFPAVHYLMGGLWVDYEANSEGRLVIGSCATSKRIFPACTPLASATTNITAPIGWGPIRCSVASSAG